MSQKMQSSTFSATFRSFIYSPNQSPKCLYTIKSQLFSKLMPNPLRGGILGLTGFFYLKTSSPPLKKPARSTKTPLGTKKSWSTCSKSTRFRKILKKTPSYLSALYSLLHLLLCSRTNCLYKGALFSCSLNSMLLLSYEVAMTSGCNIQTCK